MALAFQPFRHDGDEGAPQIQPTHLETPPVEPEAFANFRKQLCVFLGNWGEIWKDYRHIERLRQFAGHLSTTDADEMKLQAFLTYETLRLHLFRPDAHRFPPGFNSGPMHDSVAGKPITSNTAIVPQGQGQSEELSLGLTSTEGLYSGQAVELLFRIAQVIEHLYERRDVVQSVFFSNKEKARYHLPSLDIPVDKIHTFEDLELVIPHFRKGINESVEYRVQVLSDVGKIREVDDSNKDLMFACADAFVDPAFVDKPIRQVELSRSEEHGLRVRIVLDQSIGESFVDRYKLKYLPEGTERQ